MISPTHYDFSCTGTFPTLKTFTRLQPTTQTSTGPHTDADHPSSSKAS